MKKSQAIRMLMMLLMLGPAAMVISGCPAGTYGSVIQPEKKEAIVRGKTTKQDLLRELGAPDQYKDLGGGKEELSYITETVFSHSNFVSSGNTTKNEFWILLKNNIVEAFGDRSTNKSPNYFWK